jgi:hypothetical protein
VGGREGREGSNKVKGIKIWICNAHMDTWLVVYCSKRFKQKKMDDINLSFFFLFIFFFKSKGAERKADKDRTIGELEKASLG